VTRSGVTALAGVALAALLAASCAGGGAQQTATPGPSLPASVRPAGSPAATLTATPVSTPEIAYVEPNSKDIWLMAADGTSKRNVTQGRCVGLQGLEWSPQGDRIACIGSDSETLVLVFDLEGRLLVRLQHTGYFRSFFTWGAEFASPWSPNGRNLAYVLEQKVTPVPGGGPPRGTPVLVIADATEGVLASIADGQQPRWSADGGRLAYFKPPGDTLALYDLAAGQEETLAQGLRPLAWVLADKALLVAAHYQEQELGDTQVTYEANLLDPSTSQMTRVAELDNYAEFWLSPDRETAVVSSPTGPGLGIFDLSSLRFTPIVDSVIRFPSEFIPQSQLAFSSDGSQIYWADQGGRAPHAIYRANIDGTGLTKIGEVPGWFVGFSPDLTRMLYFPSSGTLGGLWLANIDGSDARLVAERASDAVCRP
jgi:Tol biopolymer transport system component